MADDVISTTSLELDPCWHCKLRLAENYFQCSKTPCPGRGRRVALCIHCATGLCPFCSSAIGFDELASVTAKLTVLETATASLTHGSSKGKQGKGLPGKGGKLPVRSQAHRGQWDAAWDRQAWVPKGQGKGGTEGKPGAERSFWQETGKGSWSKYGGSSGSRSREWDEAGWQGWEWQERGWDDAGWHGWEWQENGSWQWESNREQEPNRRISIPIHALGAIIGQGGDTLRALQDAVPKARFRLEKRGKEELFGGSLAKEADLLVWGSDAAVQEVALRVQALINRSGYNRPTQEYLHFDAESFASIALAPMNLRDCLASFSTYRTRDKSYFGLLHVPENEAVASLPSKKPSPIILGLGKEKLEQALLDSMSHLAATLAPTEHPPEPGQFQQFGDEHVEVVARLGVMLFAGAKLSKAGNDVPGALAGLHPHRDFRTQFSSHLKAHVADCFSELLRQSSFVRVRRSRETIIHVRDVDSHAGENAWPVVTLFDPIVMEERQAELLRIAACTSYAEILQVNLPANPEMRPVFLKRLASVEKRMLELVRPSMYQLTGVQEATALILEAAASLRQGQPGPELHPPL
ncbi:unnamed protein product, partial [Polarella glacialis]